MNNKIFLNLYIITFSFLLFGCTRSEPNINQKEINVNNQETQERKNTITNKGRVLYEIIPANGDVTTSIYLNFEIIHNDPKDNVPNIVCYCDDGKIFNPNGSLVYESLSESVLYGYKVEFEISSVTEIPVEIILTPLFDNGLHSGDTVILKWNNSINIIELLED